MTRTDYRHGRPLPHRLPNRPQPHPIAPEHFMFLIFQYRNTITDYPQFPEVVRVYRVVWPRVTEQFATGLTRATRMAKADSDSNGLRQDQPECSPQLELGRV